MSPRTEALAFRIWCYADPRGWDVTLHEIAEACGVTWRVAQGVCNAKGWIGRIRKTTEYGNPALRRTVGFLSEELFEGLA